MREPFMNGPGGRVERHRELVLLGRVEVHGEAGERADIHIVAS